MRKNLSRIWDLAAQLILGGVALFYLAGAAYGVVSFQYNRGIAVLYSLAAGFVLYGASAKSRSNRPSALDLVLIFLSVTGVWYWILEHENLAYRAGAYTAVDLTMGSAVTLMALEVSRRALGRSSCSWSTRLRGPRGRRTAPPWSAIWVYSSCLLRSTARTSLGSPAIEPHAARIAPIRL